MKTKNELVPSGKEGIAEKQPYEKRMKIP